MKNAVKPGMAWLLTAALAAQVLFMSSRAVMDSPLLASAFFAVVVVHFRTCRSRYEVLAVVPLAAALVMIRFGTQLHPLYEHLWWIGLFLGWASMLVMGVAVLHSRPQDMPGRIAAFGTALAAPICTVAVLAALPVTWHAHPATLDTVLYAFDNALGFQPSFIAGRLFAHLWWLRLLSKVVYETVPLAVVILYLSTVGPRDRGKHRLLLLFGIAGLAGYLLYNFVPAAGPAYLFPARFPDSPPGTAGLGLLPVALPSGVPRNAMPSLHVAWAVLMCWNARRSAIWLRTCYGFYLILTILFTLGSGEHYLVDLVVALPFALAVQAGCSVPARELPRSLAFWTGTAGTLAWLAFLRFAAPLWLGSLVLDWTLVVVTVVGSVVLERQVDLRFSASADKRAAEERKLFQGESAQV